MASIYWFVVLVTILVTTVGSESPVQCSGCRYNEMCFKEGETHGAECVTRKCEVVQLNTTHYQSSMKIIDQDCPYKGECVKEGETRDGDNCSILKCLVNKEAHSTKMEIYEIRCKDNINGTCHKNGEVMRYNFEGTLYKCNCKVSGKSAQINNCVSK